MSENIGRDSVASHCSVARICQLCQGSGWIDPTNRDLCPDCNNRDNDAVVSPRWLDAQPWLKPSEDNDEWFRKYSAFGPFCEMQIWWHAKDDHCNEWSTMYLGREQVVR